MPGALEDQITFWFVASSGRIAAVSVILLIAAVSDTPPEMVILVGRTAGGATVTVICFVINCPTASLGRETVIVVVP